MQRSLLGFFLAVVLLTAALEYVQAAEPTPSTREAWSKKALER